MSDTAFREILDREGVTALVQAEHAAAIVFFEDLTDYGTNLVARLFENSPHDLKATYLIFVHLHQLVAHLDSAGELLKKGCCFSAHLQLRSLLENYLFLKWILQSDTDNKIEHIFVADERRKNSWQSIGIPGSEAATQHAAAAARLNHTPEQISEITRKVESRQQVLENSPFRKAINDAFETRRVKSKKKRDPYWYSLCGANSIGQIATQVGAQAHYDYLYGPFSGVTHGSDSTFSIKYRTAGIEVIAIRNTASFNMLGRLAATFALNAYFNLTELYMPSTIPDLVAKYRAEWRAPYITFYPSGASPEATIDQACS